MILRIQYKFGNNTIIPEKISIERDEKVIISIRNFSLPIYFIENNIIIIDTDRYGHYDIDRPFPTNKNDYDQKDSLSYIIVRSKEYQRYLRGYKLNKILCTT